MPIRPEPQTANPSTNNGTLATWQRTDEQRKSDDELIATLMRKGAGPTEITRKINEKNSGIYSLTLSVIYRNMKQLTGEWAKEMVSQSIGEYKAAQYQKVEHLYAEVMEAWERSKREGQTMSGAVNATGETTGTRSVTRTRRDGDPRWIEAAIKLLERQAKIVGIDAPLKLEASTGTGNNDLDALRRAYRERIHAEVVSNLPKRGEDAIVDATVVESQT